MASKTEEKLPPSEASSSATGSDAASTPTKASKRPGRLLAATAFLLAFVALAGTGYLYFLLIHLNPNAKLERSIVAAQAERSALQVGLSQADEQWKQSLADFTAQMAQRVQATEAAVVERLNQAAQAGPPTERDWKLAEVEYLLQVANHRLPMERDIATALRLLRSADDILAGLDDFALVGVRSALADEILSLEQAEGVDVQGLYLRLNAVKGQLGALALAQPQFTAPKPAADGQQPAGFWAALAAEFRNLLKFRRVNAEVRPLMAPSEAVYLELNLRLVLEQAQLAVLRRDQTVFATSLDAARQWLGDHLDAADPDVQAIGTALADLRLVDLGMALPDISTSLEELRKLRRGGQAG